MNIKKAISTFLTSVIFFISLIGAELKTNASGKPPIFRVPSMPAITDYINGRTHVLYEGRYYPVLSTKENPEAKIHIAWFKITSLKYQHVILAAIVNEKIALDHQEYKVKDGDTFWNLAIKFYGTGMEHLAIKEYNCHLTNETLTPGEIISIPMFFDNEPLLNPETGEVVPNRTFTIT